MDRDAFDGLTRLLATSPSRRKALGALLGAGLAGTIGAADAKKGRGKKRKAKGGAAKGAVAAEAADCLSPGPSSNMNGCSFQGSDFSGDDLSGSSMVGTNFNNAKLVGTNLSSSNMKNATFRGANLRCADLSSSTLRNADFRGFPATGPNAGPPTDLTGADLSSSACGGILTNARTILCGTIWCDGSVRNDSCPGGPPAGSCCRDGDCAPGQTCEGGTCAGCPDGTVELDNGSCALDCRLNFSRCQAAGGPACLCEPSMDGDDLCVVADEEGTCISSAGCPPGHACVRFQCTALCGVDGA